MMQLRFQGRWMLFAAAVLSVALMPLKISAATVYVQHNLTSDIPGLADYTDPNLVNPWGLALAPFWPCNNGSGTYTVQGVDGAPTATVTIVPTAPGKTGTGKCTGAARNNNAAAFLVSPGVTGTWLLDTEDGLITIRSGAQNIVKVDNSASGAVYKGLALTNSPDYIYAANFNSGKIEVYDGNWAPATLAGNFTDPDVPAGFAPFNIQNIGGKLYVAYAKQDAAKHDDVAGPGNGFVAVFDLNGNLLRHLISGGRLNSPWGLAIAPSTFGDFKDALLVGNFRDGTTNAFDATNGNYLGTISDASGKPIINTGLWALVFGTGGNGGDVTKLYFTAGISAGDGIQAHGLFGTISVGTTPGAPPSVNDAGVVNNATFAAGTNPVAPGSIVAIFGTNLTDGSTHNDPSFDNNKRLRTSLAGAQVFVNNSLVPAPIFFASPAQLVVQLPVDLTGTSASVQVTVNGLTTPTKTFPIGAFSPGIFTLSSDGKGAGVITHADAAGTLVNADNPVQPGETIIIFATGLGPVTPAVPTGATPGDTTNTVTTPTVTIDGLPAQVQFSGLSGCCVGLNQINVLVPAAVHVGTNVNIVLSIGGRQSNTVTMPTKAAAGPSGPPPAPLTLTFSPISAQMGVAYSAAAVASGGVPPYAFFIASGSLPPGLLLDASLGMITGTPTGAGTFSFAVGVTDSTGSTALTATTNGSIEVSPPAATPNPVPAITSLSPAFVNAGAAAQTLTINGTGFMSASTVTFNGVPKAVTFAGESRLTIPLTASDLAKSGNYAVAVSNPSPGGGSSNVFTFMVVTPPPPNPYPY